MDNPPPQEHHLHHPPLSWHESFLASLVTTINTILTLFYYPFYSTSTYTYPWLVSLDPHTKRRRLALASSNSSSSRRRSNRKKGTSLRKKDLVNTSISSLDNDISTDDLYDDSTTDTALGEDREIENRRLLHALKDEASTEESDWVSSSGRAGGISDGSPTPTRKLRYSTDMDISTTSSSTVPAALRRRRHSTLQSDGSSTVAHPERSLKFGLKRKTLVLDLDETLIHSTTMGSRHHDHMIEVLVEKHVCLYYVYKRPHVDYFMKKVSEWYNVVIFTASMPEYADPVIDWLDSKRKLISRRYFRQSCTPHSGFFAKNLAFVEPDLSRVCLVDNSPVSYALNPENGIPIEAWTNDPYDEVLLEMLPFLDALRFTDDVRSVLSLRLEQRGNAVK